jgi:hypothetical protein
MVKISEIKPLSNFQLYIKYEDGIEGQQDLTRLFQIRNLDQTYFEQVALDEKRGVPVWDEELEIDGFKPYLDFTHQTFEEYCERSRKNVA